MRYHCTCPKDIPVAPDVMAKDLGENPPVLQAPIKHLVTQPDMDLHLEVLLGVGHVHGALDLIWMPVVAVFGFHLLARHKKVHQAGGEDLDVWPQPSGVQALDPHEIPPKDVDTQLVAEGGLPCILVQPEGLHFLTCPFWGM